MPIRCNKDGIEFLSTEILNQRGEFLVKKCFPEVLETPQPVDVEAFAEFNLKLRMDFQFLSHCGVYLGMMVFRDTKNIPVYDPVEGVCKYVSEPAGTVIIDKMLLEPRQRHRFRFTLAHETAGHACLHRKAVLEHGDTIFSKGDVQEPACVECEYTDVDGMPHKKLKTSLDWMEWQANSIAAAFLMPKSSVELCMEEFKTPISNLWDAMVATNDISTTFDVSSAAAFYRLKKLGYISNEIPFSEVC